MRNPAQIDKEAPQRRQSGRALTVVLAFVALGSVSALAYGVTQSFAPAEESSGVPAADRVASLSAGAKTAPTRSAEAKREGMPSAGLRGSTSTERTRTTVRKANEPQAGESNVMVALRKRREMDAASRGDWKRSGRVVSGQSANANSARFSPTSATGGLPKDAASDSPPASDSDNEARTPYTPGYADVVGVTPNTPAHRAGIRKGAQILEYNGQPVSGRLDLEKRSSAPNLPETVPIVYRDRHGNTFETDIRSGDLKASLGPAYE